MSTKIWPARPNGSAASAAFPRSGRRLVAILVAVTVILGACGAPSATSPTAVPATPAPVASATTAPAAPATSTAAQPTLTPTSRPVATPTTAAPTATAPNLNSAATLAEKGKVVFANNCARCHGDQGQGVTGPTIIGSDASLAKYGDGKGLYDFASQNMPQDKPGSLDSSSYLEVVSFILLQNKLVQPNMTIDPSTLATIKLHD